MKLISWGALNNVKVEPKGYKPLKLYKCFKKCIYIFIFFGYSFLPYPYTKSRFFRVVLKLYSFTLSICSSVFVLQNVKNIQESPYLFVVLEYIPTVLILSVTKKTYLMKFFRNLEEIDEKLNLSSSYYKRLRKIAYCFVIYALVTRVIYSAALCFSFKVYCTSSPGLLILSAFLIIAVDINQMPRLIVFSFVRYRMYMLRINMEKLFHIKPSAVVTNSRMRSSIISSYLEIYKTILDNVDALSKLMNPLFLLSLLCCFPKIMLLLYNILVLHKKGISIIHLLVLAIEAIQWGIMVCLPGIVADLTSAEVEKMKLFLLHQYGDSKEELERTEIKEFLRYIKMRPYKYRILRLIPVDLTLPVGLLNMCTTYLIVIIQFTHLFE